MFQLFGGVVEAAMVQVARREWQKVPQSEHDCLEQRNVSIDTLADRGITPADPRVRGLVAECDITRDSTTPDGSVNETPPHPASYNPRFTVDGLALGGTVYPGSNVYRSFSCRPSDQFAAFIWCQRTHIEQGKFGSGKSDVSILHSQSDSALYVSQTISPTVFKPSDINNEIEKLSEHLGLPAHVLRSEDRRGFPQSRRERSQLTSIGELAERSRHMSPRTDGAFWLPRKECEPS